MATPVITGLTLNKANYAPGEAVTLTINHTDLDRQTFTVTVTVSDSQGNTSAPASTTSTVDAGTVNFVSTGGKTWAAQTATLNQSVYTASA
jgi:5-hydroxyisourate hydrolase-like protein (transthyretin family)